VDRQDNTVDEEDLPYWKKMEYNKDNNQKVEVAKGRRIPRLPASNLDKKVGSSPLVPNSQIMNSVDRSVKINQFASPYDEARTQNSCSPYNLRSH